MFREKIVRELTEEFCYAEDVRKELKEFFVGNDLTITSDCVVPRGTLVDIETFLDRQCLPPVKDLRAGIQHVLEVSTRSAIAQAGIEVIVDWNRLPANARERIERGERVSLPTSLINWGATDIQLHKGEGAFRFFISKGRLEGKELAGGITIKTGAVQRSIWH